MTTGSDPPGGRAGRPVGAAAPPRPVRPRVSPRSMYLLHRSLKPNPAYRRLASWLESKPRLNRLFTGAEATVKRELFGCRMCGQCALPFTGYACPMTCPKQLRNGPCGGVGMDGSCEVYPDRRCVWLMAFERADGAGHAADLELVQRPIDQERWDTSSWINYWQGRDDDLVLTPRSGGA